LSASWLWGPSSFGGKRRWSMGKKRRVSQGSTRAGRRRGDRVARPWLVPISVDRSLGLPRRCHRFRSCVRPRMRPGFRRPRR
jgi:hypothetical protein